ncbi:MAG: nucleotidyl transferase AbiEii/AbiGii toxin family protein [Acidobacteriota bacterium]
MKGGVRDLRERTRAYALRIARLYAALPKNAVAPQAAQKLNVKLEIDINPPEGFQSETKLINTYFPYAVLQHDKPSFLSGKLHAMSQRRFTKGRDFFDLLFS